jgi:hypothetical protein
MSAEKPAQVRGFRRLFFEAPDRDHVGPSLAALTVTGCWERIP